MDSAQARPRRPGILHGPLPPWTQTLATPVPASLPAPLGPAPTREGGGGGWWGMGRPALFLRDQSSRPRCFSCLWAWITGSPPSFACGELTPEERGGGVRSASLSLEACPGRLPGLAAPTNPFPLILVPLSSSPSRVWSSHSCCPRCPMIQPFLNFLPFPSTFGSVRRSFVYL